MTLAAANLVPDGKLYIWDIESDELIFYDFRKYDDVKKSGLSGYFDSEDKNDDSNKEESDPTTVFDEICRNRIPLSLHWSEDDPRLLICNARKLKLTHGKKSCGAGMRKSKVQKC